jgi:glycosyltransferase involved in cell wall biosynthesis
MTHNANPLVSIGMPTYNRANSYLKQALKSAIDQTYQNIEIIVSDNCSEDNTEAVVMGFHDPRIRYYKQKENIGALGNSNFCLKQAQGAYFLRLFDDDMIDNDFVEACMNAAKGNSDAGIILTGAREIDAEGKILVESPNTVSGYSTGEFILAWFEYKVPLYLCSTIFNTKGLKELGGFHSKTNLYEDVVAYVQLAAKYGRIDVHDVKASFRRHDSNFGASVPFYKWCEDSLYLLDIMCKVAPEHSALIKERGMRYFCIRNYRHAEKIGSPIRRFLAYLKVYKTFDYNYSPVKYLQIRPRAVRLLKRNIRKIIKK